MISLRSVVSKGIALGGGSRMNPRSKGRMLLLVVLLLVGLLTGCTGRRDIDELALVLGVGIDVGKEPGTVKITTQIARPSDARGQSGSPTAGTGSPSWIATAEGKTIMEAIRNLGRYSSRRVFWAHNKVVIINEQVARRGVTDIIDFFSRNHELRMRTWFVVTSAKAEDILSTKSGQEVVTGESIDKLFRYSQIVAEAPRTDLMEFASAYLSKTTHPVLARLELRKRVLDENSQNKGEKELKPQVELSGAGVFHRDKLVGWLTPRESRGLMWFTETVDSGMYAVPCPDDENKGEATLELKQGSFKVIPAYRNGEVSFQVKMDSTMDLVELGCPSRQSIEQMIDPLEKSAMKQITEELEATLNKAQKKYKTDFLELGKTFQNVYPAEWKQLADRWDEVFARAEVEIQVSINLKSPALLRIPTRPQKADE
jgi:spore germination protein KC